MHGILEALEIIENWAGKWAENTCVCAKLVNLLKSEISFIGKNEIMKKQTTGTPFSQLQLLPLFLLQLELFIFNFLLCSVVPEFGLVEVLLYVLPLLPDVFLGRAQTLLDDGALHRLIHILLGVLMWSTELSGVRLFVLAEPIIEHTHRHILVIRARLERAILHLLFLVFQPNILQLDLLLYGSLMEPRTILLSGQRVPFLCLREFVGLRGHLGLECFFFANFRPRLTGALFSPELLLIGLLVVEYLVEILYQLLLAADTFDLPPWNHIKDIVDIVAVRVLVLAQIRLLVQIVGVTHDAVSVVGRAVWHDHQVVQIHQEAQEVEEGLSEYLADIIPLGPVKQVPHVLDRLALRLQLRLVKSLDEA